MIEAQAAFPLEKVLVSIGGCIQLVTRDSLPVTTIFMPDKDPDLCALRATLETAGSFSNDVVDSDGELVCSSSLIELVLMLVHVPAGVNGLQVKKLDRPQGECSPNDRV